jgi:hypothetical protein
MPHFLKIAGDSSVASQKIKLMIIKFLTMGDMLLKKDDLKFMKKMNSKIYSCKINEKISKNLFSNIIFNSNLKIKFFLILLLVVKHHSFTFVTI